MTNAQRAPDARLAENVPGHICIVMLSGLGDVVHGLPVANALKRAWPHARISWVTEPMPAGILKPHPAIDQVFVYRKKDGLAGVLDLWRQMRRERFDLTLNLHPYFKSIFGTLFSRAPVRWTLGPDRARDGVWLAGNRRLPARPRQHTQDTFLEFLHVLGVEPDPIEWKLAITDEERAEQRRFIDRLEGRPAVAVVAASGNAKKDWPAERYVPVIDAIQTDLGARAVLIGGPGEREQAAVRVITERAEDPPIDLTGSPVRSMIWQLDACSAVVAPDTGPLHLARTVDTRTVGLFGHTNPWRVGPYRTDEDLWIDEYTDGEPDPSNFTSKLGRMERIEPHHVIEKLELALSRGRT